MENAKQESRRLNHEWVGTEHILIGLLADPGVDCVYVFRKFGVNREALMQSVRNLILACPPLFEIEHRPLTPRAKLAIELAHAESHEIGTNYLGCEHILLGLIRERDGVAGNVLSEAGLELDSVREFLFPRQKNKNVSVPSINANTVFCYETDSMRSVTVCKIDIPFLLTTKGHSPTWPANN